MFVYQRVPLWKILVSWDDDIPNWMEKMFQTTNQMLMFNVVGGFNSSEKY